MSRNRLGKNKLENLIIQEIGSIYKRLLGHSLGSVYIQQFDSNLVIVLEGIVTSLERFLYEKRHYYLVDELRSEIDNILSTKVREIFEKSGKAQIIDFLSDSSVHTNVTGIVIIFKADF